MHSAAATKPETIGREDELAEIGHFLEGLGGIHALVLTGEPGTGKTTLWQAGLSIAAASGKLVLSAAAAEAEASLPFTVLTDLLRGFDAERRELPDPQRRALEVAMLLEDAAVEAPEPRAIGLGVAGVLASLARKQGVLLAIDDLQWLDRASAEAIAFAVRRLGERAPLLATRRSGSASPVEQAYPPARLRTVPLEGLSLGAIRHVLADRFGLQVSRRVLRQIHETTLGNPMFVIEVGRVIAASGAPAIGEGITVPDSLQDLVGARVMRSDIAREGLLVVGLAGVLSEEDATAASSTAAVEHALDLGLIVNEAGRLRPAHPLLAAVAIQRSTARDRRRVHERLAELTADPVRRARHIAAAAGRADPGLAAVITDAARAANDRGATEEAIELAAAALRLTPDGTPTRQDRVLHLGDLLLRGRELGRLRALLDVELATLQEGPMRARGLLLRTSVTASQAEYDADLATVIEQSDDPAIRARALALQALDRTISWLADLDMAAMQAAEAARLDPTGVGGQLGRHAMDWIRVMRGATPELADGGSEQHLGDLRFSNVRLAGIRAAFRGEIVEAERLFARVYEAAEQMGDVNGREQIRHQQTELELRRGDVGAARRLQDERSHPDQDAIGGGTQSNEARFLGMIAALEGRPDATRRHAADAIRLERGGRWDTFESLRAIAIAALYESNHREALQTLEPVWAHLQRAGIDDPGAFPIAPELVEAALGCERADLAVGVISWLDRVTTDQRHPWGGASVVRCAGLHAAFEGRHDEGAALLREAAARYVELDLGFDAARCLLLAGRSARRARKWAVARDALEEAASRFDACGCTGWGAQARALVEGLGGRRPRNDGRLTPSEQRAVELARDGLSNKEIAAAMFVGVHTVEVHLGRAYAKLGVQSRAQLGRVLGPTGEPAV